MTERPILFSGPMVRAILEGRKTQTRRVVKPQPVIEADGRMHHKGIGWTMHHERLTGPKGVGTMVEACPYGQPGDRLWVRETCNIAVDKSAVMYLDQGGKLGPDAPAGSEAWAREWRTCPSIHMPRWASRLTLEITGVRVERLQDIGEQDAVAEGVEPNFVPPDMPGEPHISGFIELWDSLNAARGQGWDANPWVWVLEFRRIS